jgi:hypothetical protein
VQQAGHAFTSLAEGLEIELLERHWLGVVERIAARRPKEDELAEAV